MSGLVLMGWVFSLGFSPVSLLDTAAGTLRYNDVFIQGLEADFLVAGIFRVYTAVEIRETKAHDIYFDPYRADFRLGGELLYKGFFLGAIHECDHDIVTGSDVHPYNGWDGAFTAVYAGWSGKYFPYPGITLAPSFALEWRPSERFYLKDPAAGNYFNVPGDSKVFFTGNTLLWPSLKLAAGFDGVLFLSFGFRPEYSALSGTGRWRKLGFDTGLEIHYDDNIALKISWTRELLLEKKAGWAFSEFRLSLSFRGKSPLFGGRADTGHARS